MPKEQEDSWFDGFTSSKFFDSATTLGFRYADKNLNSNEDAKANEKLQQSYDRLLSASTRPPVAMSMPPIDTKLLLFGGVGVLALILLLKGK